MLGYAMTKAGRFVPFIDPWPTHPTMVAAGRWGTFDMSDLQPGDEYDVAWAWTECDGTTVISTSEGAACMQPGFCVVHDPAGTIVPW